MTHKEDFDAFMLDAAAHETEPIEHKKHPSLEVFFDSLAGELPPDAQSRFVAHVATCPQCQARYQSLNEELQSEREALSSKEQVPNLAEVARQRNEKASWEKRVHDAITALIPKRGLGSIWVTAMASATAIIVAFVVTVPALWGPSAAVSESLAALSQEVESLQSQVGALAQGGITIPANFAPSSEPSMDDLLKLVNSIQGIADPWQRSLIVSSFLAEHGIVVPQNLDWSNLSSYTVKSGDSLQSISFNELGNDHLWPLIFLLNAEHWTAEEFPSPGEHILLPSVTR